MVYQTLSIDKTRRWRQEYQSAEGGTVTMELNCKAPIHTLQNVYDRKPTSKRLIGDGWDF